LLVIKRTLSKFSVSYVISSTVYEHKIVNNFMNVFNVLKIFFLRFQRC